MRHVLSLVIVVAIAPLLIGCGTSQPGSTGGKTTGNEKIGPEYTVFRFLEAVRTGNAEQAGAQLTPLAKRKTKEFNLDVAPAGSETASFRVGTVRRTPDGTAWVASQWTDLDAQGKPHTDEITWKVLEIDGKWLVAGMSTQIAADRPPILLNFEDPEDMIRQKERLDADMSGRSEGQTLEARKGDPFRTGPK